MSKGWRLVARLGGTGTKYPHVLVDSHGWCLRLRASTRREEKYYSNLPSLLQGMIEHTLRRRLMSTGPINGIDELILEVRDGLRSALDICQEAVAQVPRELQAHGHLPVELASIRNTGSRLRPA